MAKVHFPIWETGKLRTFFFFISKELQIDELTIQCNVLEKGRK